MNTSFEKCENALNVAGDFLVTLLPFVWIFVVVISAIWIYKKRIPGAISLVIGAVASEIFTSLNPLNLISTPSEEQYVHVLFLIPAFMIATGFAKNSSYSKGGLLVAASIFTTPILVFIGFFLITIAMGLILMILKGFSTGDCSSILAPLLILGLFSPPAGFTVIILFGE